LVFEIKDHQEHRQRINLFGMRFRPYFFEYLFRHRQRIIPFGVRSR